MIDGPSGAQHGLEVRGLRYEFPGWPPTLAGVDLDVAPGEAVFLVGPSGAGKSTLLRCVAGLAQPQAGSVAWDGSDLSHVPPHHRRFALMAQEPALFPHLNAWRNVAFAMPYRGVPRRQRRAEAERLLQLVGLEGRATAGVDELSGGQRQRVELARTLAARPRLVLLDEPFAGLDHALRSDLGPKVRDLLRAHGIASLWVTHDEAEARALGDRVLRLVAGRLEPA